MKKLLIAFLGAVFATGSVTAQNYPKNIVGLRAGFNTSWVTSYGVSTSAKPSYMVGVSDQVLLSRALPFYFETGLNFISKGYKINGHDESTTTFNYLQIPIGINYHIYTCKSVTIEPAVGVYYAVGLGGKREFDGVKTSVFTDGSTSRHDFGFSCGISTSIHKFHFGIAYEMGLLNIDKTDLIYGADRKKVGYKQLKNKSIIIKVGINF